VIAGDSVINQYHEGNLRLGVAEKKLDDLGVPESMKQRLYDNKEKEQHE